MFDSNGGSRLRKFGHEFVLLSIAAIWGFNYTIGKYGVAELSPVVFNTLRFLAAAPLLLLMTYLTEGTLAVGKRHLPRLAAVGLVGITLYQSCFMLSVQYAPAAKSSLLIAASPVFSSVFSLLFGKERWSWKMQLGSLVALSGTALVLFGGGDAGGSYPHETLGIVAGLLASVSWGLYPVLTAPLLESYSAVRITAWSSAIGAIPLLLISFAQGFAGASWKLSASAWFSLLYSVFLVTIFGLIFWYRTVGRVGPSKVMLYMYLIPIFAVLFAFVANGEPLHPAQAAGCLVAFVGIALSNGLIRGIRKGRRPSRDPGAETPL